MKLAPSILPFLPAGVLFIMDREGQRFCDLEFFNRWTLMGHRIAYRTFRRFLVPLTMVLERNRVRCSGMHTNATIRVSARGVITDQFESLEPRMLLSSVPGHHLDLIRDVSAHPAATVVIADPPARDSSQAHTVIPNPIDKVVWYGADDNGQPKVAGDPAGMNVAKLSQVTLNQFGDGSTRANDITSYVSPTGREYAIIGLERVLRLSK